MKPTLTGVLLVAAAFAAINTADAQGKSPAPAYTLSVRIDPAAGRVEGKTEVRGLQDTAVMLNAAMEISRFESAGRAVPGGHADGDPERGQGSGSASHCGLA